MPVIYQKFIYRADLRANPDVLYLFGDNLHRKGMGGQAKEMRGEPNAVGIATKAKPSQLENSFFDDDYLPEFKRQIMTELIPVIDHLSHGGVLIIPLDGLGTGLSELPERAPLINDHLLETLATLAEI